jgi:putative membrane protein
LPVRYPSILRPSGTLEFSMSESDSEQPSHDAARFQVKATADSHFGWMRTRMAVERTMMAWIRTAVALIGFGFTIVQFFERFADFEGVAAAIRPWAPRYLGLALMGVGVAALLVSAVQYRSFIRYMWGKEFAPIAGWGDARHNTPIYAITIVMLFIGLFAFFAVLLRAL